MMLICSFFIEYSIIIFLNLLIFLTMNKSEIGFNAGKVWQLLCNNQRWTYAALKKASGLDDLALGAAIGWLAREDKIEIYQNDDDLYLYLYVNIYIG
ncbi:hypothetical protein HMPREF1981_02431 [Bacteroides pyogenes F0041]|nr:hypothetical protein HMPREF1981_02431 [Bacteroides pyogenes F0041]GAE15092.1 hypothetical protein JCM6292_1321 [Bacteroides pyogenes JCM 6292]GAE18761.1 hypothetical protein JCM6294_1711 [Bacteroides pyogenes DSM 20611 = JCM 6294]GAE21465.1 hypothetical protein JCM10003_922 [Bacteroides pyogenes JCM 10003]